MSDILREIEIHELSAKQNAAAEAIAEQFYLQSNCGIQIFFRPTNSRCRTQIRYVDRKFASLRESVGGISQFSVEDQNIRDADVSNISNISNKSKAEIELIRILNTAMRNKLPVPWESIQDPRNKSRPFSMEHFEDSRSKFSPENFHDSRNEFSAERSLDSKDRSAFSDSYQDSRSIFSPERFQNSRNKSQFSESHQNSNMSGDESFISVESIQSVAAPAA